MINTKYLQVLILCLISISVKINLHAQHGFNNVNSCYIKPKTIKVVANGSYFIDFGKAAFGTLSLKIPPVQYDSITIHLGEKQTGQNCIDTNPGGTIRYKKVVLTNVKFNKLFNVELPADGRNDNYPAIILPDSFARVIPFRYCQIEGLHLPVNSFEILQKAYFYKFNDTASMFTSSDTVLNHIWDLCKYTIKATGFCGKYIDGDRERIPYEADAFINQLSHYAVDNEYTLAQQTNEHFIDNPTWPTEWILHTVLLFYYDYLYTGNTTLLKKHYNSLKHKTLINIASANGLISTTANAIDSSVMKNVGFDIKYTGRKIEDIVDWPHAERDGYQMTSFNTVVNSFYYINLKLMAKIAKVLDNKYDAEMFTQKAIAVKDTINALLFNQQTGLYIDGLGSKHSSLHANMFPLAFDIVPQQHKNSVVKFIKSRGMACSVYGAQYLLEALYKANEPDYALSLITNTNGNRNWWNMIKTGSSMTLEAWDIKYKPNLDWNHAWGTAPANIITRYLWGITPAIPGFKTAIINPQMASITSSSIKVPTINGSINAQFLKNNNITVFIIELPKGTDALFVVPNLKVSQIILNNNILSLNIDTLKLNMPFNKIEIINN